MDWLQVPTLACQTQIQFILHHSRMLHPWIVPRSQGQKLLHKGSAQRNDVDWRLQSECHDGHGFRRQEEVLPLAHHADEGGPPGPER